MEPILDASMSVFGEAPGLPAIPPPDARQLDRWYGERPRHQRRWALILEPHRKLAELLAYILDFELGVQSVFVPRPHLIPNLFRRWTPDLIITEIPASAGAPSLRDLENLQLLLEAAQAQPMPVPVLLCTTYTDVTPAIARQVGFADLIHKPFTPALLTATARALLGPAPVNHS